MPYFHCPNCELTLYGTAPANSTERCPRCDADLAVREIEDGPPTPEPVLRDRRRFNGGAPPEVLVRLQERISSRVGYGYSMVELERELIEPSPANETQRAALRRFAARRLQARSSH